MYTNSVAPTVSFGQASYTVGESDESVEPLLVLSNPSSTDVTVQVYTSDGSATGIILIIMPTIWIY